MASVIITGENSVIETDEVVYPKKPEPAPKPEHVHEHEHKHECCGKTIKISLHFH